MTIDLFILPLIGTMMWVGIGSAVLGAGTSLYGISQQKKANAKATDANTAAIDRGNQIDWNNYLLTRGLNTGGTATPGQIPTTTQAVNTRLPLWATMATPVAQPAASSASGQRWVKRSALPGTLTRS